MTNPHRFFSRWQNWFALVLVLGFGLIAIFAPFIAPPIDGEEAVYFRKVENLKGQAPFPPGKETVLGTVPTGIRGSQYDVFYTLVWGTRSALKFGLLAALGTAVLGVILGAVSAIIGGWGDHLIMRITDAFLAIVLFSWMPYTRLTHSMVYRVKKAEFVEAARALGAGSFHMLFKHLIPNSISPAVVLAARDIGGMVLLQATFTFIGMGGGSEWGQLLAIGRRWVIGAGGNLIIYWWVFVPITLALVLFGVSWSLLGDGVNDWLNPHLN